MPITMARVASMIIGTSPTSPVSTQLATVLTSSPVSWSTSSNIIESTVVVSLTIPATFSGSTAPTVQFKISLDGTNYFQPGPTITVPLLSGTYNYEFDPPDACWGVDVLVTPGITETSSNFFTCYAQISTLAVS